MKIEEKKKKILKYKDQIDKYSSKISELEEKIEDINFSSGDFQNIKVDANKEQQMLKEKESLVQMNLKEQQAMYQKEQKNKISVREAKRLIEEARQKEIALAQRYNEIDRKLKVEDANIKANERLKLIAKAVEVQKQKINNTNQLNVRSKTNVTPVKPLTKEEIIEQRKKTEIQNKVLEEMQKKEEAENKRIQEALKPTQSKPVVPPIIVPQNVRGLPKKVTYKYNGKSATGEKINGYYEAYYEQEVKEYLKSEQITVISLKPIKEIKTSFLAPKLTYADLSFLLTQLSTYLKAGIPLVDSVKILERQAQQKWKKKIFASLIYELSRGETFSNALESQGSAFPKLLTNMVRAAELTGDLPGVLDDMTEYYTAIDKTRKAMIGAMTYPLIIFFFSLVVVSFVLIYIVPKFVSMFEQNDASLPTITVIIINTSNFLKNNIVFVALIIIAILAVYLILFKKVQSFRKVMQTISMRLPVIGNIIIYNEVTMFTKTFASLLNHNVFITQSMDILGKISDNEVYKGIIDKSLKYLSRGSKISESFKGEWAFPVVAYEMLLTGENTGQLGQMMKYVSDYYQDLHANAIKRVNTFIEPIMIVFLAVSIGIILLAIIIPMFSFYNQIQ